MPIALERGSGIGRPGFGRGIGWVPIYELPEAAGIIPAGRKLDPAAAVADSSTSSSSIGKNSDGESAVSNPEDAGEEEVQSTYRGSLETMDALEESLPIRRGISNFYRGKSISFTSLADAMKTCSSSKDLAKPENAYTCRRRNLLAFKHTWDRPHGNPLRGTGGGISKRPANSSRSTLTLAVAMCNSGSSGTYSEEERDQRRLLPPLHPSGKPASGASPLSSSPPQKCPLPMRSFSLTELQGMAGSISSIGHRDKHK